jgi:hypothetical protein
LDKNPKNKQTLQSLRLMAEPKPIPDLVYISRPSRKITKNAVKRAAYADFSFFEARRIFYKAPHMERD